MMHNSWAVSFQYNFLPSVDKKSTKLSLSVRKHSIPSFTIFTKFENNKSGCGKKITKIKIGTYLIEECYK